MSLSSLINKSSFSFSALQNKTSEEYQLIQKFYKQNIEPIYGNQDTALEKLLMGKDRKCELLYTTNNSYVGAIVYKTQLTQEFKTSNFPNTLELKSMFLLVQNQKLAGLFFSLLLLRGAKKASEIKADFIVCTVSSKRKNVLNLMLKSGFQIHEIIEERYSTGINEYTLVHSEINHLISNLEVYASKITQRLP